MYEKPGESENETREYAKKISKQVRNTFFKFHENLLQLCIPNIV